MCFIRSLVMQSLPQAELNQLELQFLLLNDLRLVIPGDETQNSPWCFPVPARLRLRQPQGRYQHHELRHSPFLRRRVQYRRHNNNNSTNKLHRDHYSCLEMMSGTMADQEDDALGTNSRTDTNTDTDTDGEGNDTDRMGMGMGNGRHKNGNRRIKKKSAKTRERRKSKESMR
ncbi:hypothetical protein D9758_016113 [Tetrapyrgos nigripes]|uniref:Uncharacterized protein n=1 Tax=Tetrapyrgos nigripes TaxID=182062 RepID=A0A8H5BZA7_9AGAR|nr:hypothetical protein D9758_016113 [Tetrapyrgos nigripes]